MHLIEVTPAPCISCGKGNTTNAHGEQPQFVDIERDVNWNEPVILCEDCILKIGGMIGMPNPEQLHELKKLIRAKDTELHAQQAEIDKMKRRVKRMGLEFAK